MFFLSTRANRNTFLMATVSVMLMAQAAVAQNWLSVGAEVKDPRGAQNVVTSLSKGKWGTIVHVRTLMPEDGVERETAWYEFQLSRNNKPVASVPESYFFRENESVLTPGGELVKVQSIPLLQRAFKRGMVRVALPTGIGVVDIALAALRPGNEFQPSPFRLGEQVKNVKGELGVVRNVRDAAFGKLYKVETQFETTEWYGFQLSQNGVSAEMPLSYMEHLQNSGRVVDTAGKVYDVSEVHSGWQTVSLNDGTMNAKAISLRPEADLFGTAAPKSSHVARSPTLQKSAAQTASATTQTSQNPSVQPPIVTNQSSSDTWASSGASLPQAPAPTSTAARVYRAKPFPSVTVQNGDGKNVEASALVAEFSRDLVEEAQRAKIQYIPDPDLRVVEDSILRGLLKPEGGSVRLLAPAGVGKTVLIQRLMARIAAGDVPEEIRGYRFMGYSAASLQTGSRFSGSVDTKVNAMIELSRKAPIVWIVDEIHSLAGAGTHSQNSNDIFQTFKPELATGVVKMIGLTTPDEWSSAFDADPALSRRFVRVDVPVPSGEKLVRILNSWIQRYKLEPMPPKLLDEAIRLSDEFSIDGAQPSRTTALLAEIYAEKKINPSPWKIEDLHLAAKRLWNVDPSEFTPKKRRERVENLKKALEELAGQNEVKTTIIDKSEEVLAGMHDRSKSRYRLLFGGPKGQGKTEFVKVFSKAMGLPEDNRIMMSAFTSPHQVEEMKNQIATYILRNQFTVLFFDEIEKAHIKVQQALLGILDNGEMTYEVKNGQKNVQKTLRLKNASVFMATNAGQSYIERLKDKSEFNETSFREAMVKDGLDEFMVDRMAKVLPFFFLSKSDFSQVLRIHIGKALTEIAKNAKKTVNIANLPAMIEALTNKYFSPRMSNREASRIVEEFIRLPVQRQIVNQVKPRDNLYLTWTAEGLKPTPLTYTKLPATPAGGTAVAPWRGTSVLMNPQSLLSCRQLF